MIPWQVLRTICTVLLLLPVVHLAFLMSREVREELDHSPEAWAREVNQYVETDTHTALPENPVVVVGGRRVKLWPDLPDLLAPRPVLMRGIGGAVIEDITFNYSRLIGHYQPAAVVLVPDNSEFHVRDNKSGAELLAAIRELTELDAAHETTRRFYVVTPVKTLLRSGDYPVIEEAAHLLRDWAARDERIVLLDINPLLAGPDGLPKPAYFRGDGVNLNEHGYLRLSILLLSALEAEATALAAVADPP